MTKCGVCGIPCGPEGPQLGYPVWGELLCRWCNSWWRAIWVDHKRGALVR